MHPEFSGTDRDMNASSKLSTRYRGKNARLPVQQPLPCCWALWPRPVAHRGYLEQRRASISTVEVHQHRSVTMLPTSTRVQTVHHSWNCFSTGVHAMLQECALSYSQLQCMEDRREEKLGSSDGPHLTRSQPHLHPVVKRNPTDGSPQKSIQSITRTSLPLLQRRAQRGVPQRPTDRHMKTADKF